MKSNPFVLLSVVHLLFISRGYGAKILFFHTVGTTSHRTSIWPLAEKLGDLGHKITYIFPVNNAPGSHPNIEEITPSKLVPLLKQFISDFDINFRLNNTLLQWTMNGFERSSEFCEAMYQSPEIKRWLATPKLHYDLIFVDMSLGECGYGLVHHFKSKYIFFLPLFLPHYVDGLGLPFESYATPDYHFHVEPTQMSFFNRVLTTLSPILFRFAYDLQCVNKLLPVIERSMNITKLPPISEYYQNSSLVFFNNYAVEEYPMALPPSFVSYSGLWCTKDKLAKTKPLPKNMEEFIGNSEGFVYMSFGSAVVVSGMPESLRNTFFTAFESFSKLKFFLRWPGDKPDNIPKNVMLAPWFPQNDILAHPKIKGFIMQGGRPSTQEALCHAVPMLTIPIFVDQDYNADRLVYLGIGVKLNIDNLTVDVLKQGIVQLIDNPKLKERTVEMSKLFRDRVVDPLDNVVYWTEYALRHNTTALRSMGMTMPWYQRRLLDVYAFLAIVLMTIAGTTTFIIYKCTMRICGRKHKMKKA